MKKFELSEEELDLLIRFAEMAQDEYWYLPEMEEFKLHEKLVQLKQELQSESEEES